MYVFMNWFSVKPHDNVRVNVPEKIRNQLNVMFLMQIQLQGIVEMSLALFQSKP